MFFAVYLFFFAFFWGGVVLSCLYIYIFFVFSNFYMFLDQCRKTVCPPPLYNLPRCFGTFLQTGQAAVTGSPPVFQKKTSTICHVVLPKSRILKNAKKKVYKVPPKMGTLYENVAGTL